MSDTNEYHKNSLKSNYRWLWSLGNQLGTAAENRTTLSNQPHQLAFVFNINGNHWVACVIDFRQAEILFGDSLQSPAYSGTLASAPYIQTLLWWSHQHSSKRFTVSQLPITRQTDGASCGILACNALSTYLSEGLSPLLDMENVFGRRLDTFLQLTCPKSLHLSSQVITNYHSAAVEIDEEETRQEGDVHTCRDSDIPDTSSGHAECTFDAFDEAVPTTDSEMSDVSMMMTDDEDISPNPEPRSCIAFPETSSASNSNPLLKETSQPTSSKKRTLNLRVAENDNTGILRYVKRSTKEEMLAQVQIWSEEHAERLENIQHQQKIAKLAKQEDRRDRNRLHKQNSRARQRQREIESGKRLPNGVKPPKGTKEKDEVNMAEWKDNLPVVTPEDTRPAKKIKCDIREKNRKPQGRKPVDGSEGGKAKASYYNWLTPITWPLIQAAGAAAGPTMSRTEIARILQARHGAIFRNIHPNTIDGWIDRKSGPRPVWSSKVLRRVQEEGFNPVYNPLGRGDILLKYPDIAAKIKAQLDFLRKGGAPITLTTARGIIIAHIQTFAPQLFQQVFKDGLTFTASEVWVRRWLHREMKWSRREATQAAGKLPEDWENQCKRSFFRKAYSIKEHDIPAALFINSDQTQLVYAPGSKVTWAETGAKQVQVLGIDEKRAITVMVSVACDGTALPLQAIYTGKTHKSLPSPQSPNYNDAIEAGFQFVPSGTGTYWSTVETMQQFVEKILVPYTTATKARLGLRDHQKSLWNIDIYSVHRSDDFRTYMRKTHTNIILDFVPDTKDAKDTKDQRLWKVRYMSFKDQMHLWKDIFDVFVFGSIFVFDFKTPKTPKTLKTNVFGK
ncbi:hypothetical protein CVT24_010855 [Panaeolus cyanescens]|uniref:Ubiquitin-like protease family profile domain-containing protein n=1 Tax=Panaeolus cyanescens TaxID=181874 RepID=A0A409YYG0_9AGAR|nr:hypothetical protein CVT24_010855 [Panaeolus cyanescens]